MLTLRNDGNEPRPEERTMTPTTDLLRRAARRHWNLAKSAPTGHAERILRDGNALDALADQMERAEPVGTVRTCVWNGTSWTVSLHVPTKMRVRDPLYAHPAPEVTRDAETIRRMVDAFLGWPLPESFSPDAGISFEPRYNVGTPHEGRYKPSGTNLLDSVQASELMRFLLDAAMQEPKP